MARTAVCGVNFLKKKNQEEEGKSDQEPILWGVYNFKVLVTFDCTGLENYHFSLISNCYFLLNLRFIFNVFAIDKSEAIYI